MKKWRSSAWNQSSQHVSRTSDPASRLSTKAKPSFEVTPKGEGSTARLCSRLGAPLISHPNFLLCSSWTVLAPRPIFVCVTRAIKGLTFTRGFRISWVTMLRVQLSLSRNSASTKLQDSQNQPAFFFTPSLSPAAQTGISFAPWTDRQPPRHWHFPVSGLCSITS